MPDYIVTDPQGQRYRVTAPEGASEDEAIAYAQKTFGGQSPQPAAPPPEQRSMGEDALRELGLTARDFGETAAEYASMPSDAIFGLVNFIQAKRGKPMPFKLARETIKDAITAAGAPEAETTGEKFRSAARRGMIGAGGLVALGNRLAGSAPAVAGALESAPATAAQASQGAAALPAGAVTAPAPAPAAQAAGALLSAAPGAQATGALGGAAGAAAAQAAGLGPVGQMVGGLAGGVTGGVAATVPTAARSAGRAAGAAAAPLSQGGRETIAGAVLRQASTNTDDALRNLDAGNTLVPVTGRAGAPLKRVGEIVPGSAPTTGQLARDPGLAFFENRMRALNGSAFAQRGSQQNAARHALLDTVADGGLPQRVLERLALRERTTEGLRDNAFAQAAGKRVRTEQILDDIDNLADMPDNAGQSVQSAIKTVRQWIAEPPGRTRRVDGIEVTEPLSDARSLYAVRKEINRILEGRYTNSDESTLRYAGGQLRLIRDSIDSAIMEVAPDWRRYLTKYAQLSRPIERTETIQALRDKTGLAAPDIETGRDFISQPKWKQSVTRAMPELRRTLTQGQIKKLETISADLDRGAAATNAANIKIAGSDTAANLVASGEMSVAYVVGRAMGTDPSKVPKALNSVARPLAWLYRTSDDEVKRLITEAMLDPQLAARLMRKGTPENVRMFAEALEAAQSSQIGAAAATAATGAGSE